MSDLAEAAAKNSLYETDFFEWTQLQARLLRERRFADLDLANLVDEVEGVGSSEKREIRNRLKVLLIHLIKWRYQPGRRGESWRRTIREQRSQLAEITGESPSLAAYVAGWVPQAYPGATVGAAEETGISVGMFPVECPFSATEVLDMDFLPESRSSE